MLTRDKIISIFCLIDDLFIGINHKDDSRRNVSDSEIAVTAIVSAIYFGGNQYHAIHLMKSMGFVPKMVDKSRFNRRLHAIGRLLYDLFAQVGHYLKQMRCEMHYIIDSFPVAVCDNIRIMKSKLIKGNKWRGYTASMKRFFYGVKVQLLTTGTGIPVAFFFTPGKQADVKALAKIIRELPPEACVYGDSAYTDYKKEDDLFANDLIFMKIQRKSNSKRKDTKQQIQEKLKMRKRVETSISDIKKLFPRTIHAVTLNGFLIKLILFVFGLQINKITN
ncbi:MAG: IS982 family transposase [Parachlamydiaceae bacterium]|nr:IS982 family transposase [Parachlamydiaceae bacterium]